MLLFYLSVIETEEDRIKFERLYKQYYKLMIYIANGILHNQQDAEDATHAACLMIIENLEKVDDVESPRTKAYVAVIVKNISINMNVKKERISMSPLETVDFLLHEQNAVEELVENQLKNSGLLREINRLPENHRDVLLLKHYYGCSFEEIAKILDLSLDNIRKIHQRAKQKLMQELKTGITK